MSIILQLKSVASAISGSALRSLLIADALTAETEINRHSLVVDAQHNSDGSHANITANSLTTPSVTLGGVTKTAWPTSTAGSTGTVVISGATTLNGVSGVTITHNKGDLNYLVKVTPTGISQGDTGEISYVKSANTVAVYNTGRPRLAADFELSAI
jgi:hypothetical protein